MAELMAYTS